MIAGEVMRSLVTIYPVIPAKMDSFERNDISFERLIFH
jgi:hypothetical protein